MKIWIRRIISVALIIAVILPLQKLVVPKYANGVLEGTFTPEYYNEKYNHQVLMIGDCEAYENYSPMVLWKKYGITSYIRGNAQQLAWHGYYLLKEALERGEKPDIVIFSVLALKYNEPQKEEYNRVLFDYMKPSLTKLQALRVSMMPKTEDEVTGEEIDKEHYLDYIFPILRYHSRLSELEDDDFTYYGKIKQHTIAGYYMRCDVLPVGAEDIEGIEDEEEEEEEAYEEESEEEIEIESDESALEELEEEAGGESETEEILEDYEESEEEEILEETEETEEYEEDEEDEDEDETEIPERDRPLGDNAMSYLDKIRELCEQKNIPLILIKAPSIYPVWYEKWEQQIEDYAAQYQLPYLNYLEMAEEIGIDWNTDTYDGGLHMNLYGAEKCADHLGQYLKEHYDLADMREDAQISADWAEKEAFYEAKKADQLEQIKEHGKVLDP